MDALALLEKFQAIAKTGRHYSKNADDPERYEQLLERSSNYYGQILGTPTQQVRGRLLNDPGAVTPKVGADAAIFDAQGRILLMLRSDNQKWCLPGGLMDVGETPEQCAIREAKEETGLEARALEWAGVFTRFPMSEYTPSTVVSLVYLCEVADGRPRSSHEDLGLAYWNIDEVPIWHAHEEAQARMAQVLWAKHQGKYE